MKFLKKAEFEHFKDNKSGKMKKKLEKLTEMVEVLETRLDREITEKGEQYSTGCEIIEKRLEEHMIPVR